MQVRNADRNHLRRVTKIEVVVHGDGHRGDMGTAEVTLECGHTLRAKYSQVKKNKSMRCAICGPVIKPYDRRDQESGPYRNRNQQSQRPDSLGALGYGRIDPS